MNKKTFWSVALVICFGFLLITYYHKEELGSKKDEIQDTETVHHVTGIILSEDEEHITLEDKNENIYKFDKDDVDEKVGTEVSIEYKKENNKTNSAPKKDVISSVTNPKPEENKDISDNKVIDYEVVNESKIPDAWLDNGLFGSHYTKAFSKLQSMSLDEKIGQTLLVRYPVNNASKLISNYKIGGYVFFERDFKGKTKDQVINMISSTQTASSIPLLTAIDEEGGKVSRLSSNSLLTSEPFKSPQDLFTQGGFDAIASDVKRKSSVLKGLGLNLNLAPVVDVSTDPNNYIYKRTLGQGTEATSTYSKTVIEASKGLGVSYTLKHFPGYGSNTDTHVGGSTSQKSYEDIMKQDIPPFLIGIQSGAEAVMVSHNIVSSIDNANESSISAKMHELLRNNLKFTGIVITDDISMGAMKNVSNVASKAINAGNDILITSDVASSFNQIKTSVNNSTVSMDTLDRAVFRILAWKYYKNLL